MNKIIDGKKEITIKKEDFVKLGSDSASFYLKKLIENSGNSFCVNETYDLVNHISMVLALMTTQLFDIDD
jgi:hypothetical protein